MEWIDTHTHLYGLKTLEERDAYVKRAVEAGVSKFVLAGVDEVSNAEAKAFCSHYSENAYACIGLHPTEVKADYRQVLERMEADIEKKIFRYVGIGETGLDFYTEKCFALQQQEAFRIQIAWAKRFHLPLVLHIRAAFEEAVHILKEEQDGSLRGVFHCFGGSIEQAKQALDLGFYLGIGGVLTFKNSHLGQTVEKVDLKYLVLETDAPYLAPHPYRGKTNESSYISLVGYKLAEIKAVAVEQVAYTTTENARELYKI